MRGLVPSLVLCLVLATTLASAQIRRRGAAAHASREIAAGTRVAWRGFVHRETSWGCGQMWSSHVASSDVTLDVDARGRVRLHVDAHVVDASGGVSHGTAHHQETPRSLTIEWRGRARVVGGALVIDLSALTETAPAPGSTLVVTNRTTLAARLTCTRAMHDVMQASHAIGDPAIARRPITTCTFEPVPREGALPRPVADVLSTPFFLDEGAGITTDAVYRGGIGPAPGELVAREPGWVEP